MKRYLIETLKLYLFWMVFFLVGRTVFLLSYTNLLADIPCGETMSVYWHALKLDTSAACWLTAPVFLLMSVQLAYSPKWLNTAKKILMGILLTICTLTIFGEIGIYDEWQVKINHKALLYLRRPAEIFDSVSTGRFLLLLFCVIAYVGLFEFLYCKFVARPTMERTTRGWLKAPISFIIGGGLIFVGMRGGFGDIPISQSQSYFSQHHVLNDAAVNTPWNLMHNYLHFNWLKTDNPFKAMPDEEAERIVAEMHSIQPDSTTYVLNTDNPNIVIVMLESWSADVVASLGKENRPGVTPWFDKLEEEGLLFTDFYSNGHRSQQAMSSILSDFPPMQSNDVTDYFSLYRHLGSMPKYFSAKGYSTAFYFGGDLNYGNIRAFILWNEFQKIFEGRDFPKNVPHGKLSVPDQYLFEHTFGDLKAAKAPFFNVIFTGSSHSPYDEPKTVKQITWNVDNLKYLNSVKYSDSCLYDYIKKAQELPSYRNTLFILVGDHSHATYQNHYVNSREYMHIPMLWIGGALKEEYRGERMPVIGSHVDIFPTLLRQLHDDTTQTYRGVNMFNAYNKGFAYYETNYGLGWITPEGNHLYNAERQSIESSDYADSTVFESELKKSRAYLQTLYRFFTQD